MDAESNLDLRALSEQEFIQRYAASRFTCEVLANRARYVAEHICTALLHRAFSPIITFSQDFVGALIGAPEQGYPLTAVNKGNVIFLGSLATGVRDIVREFGLERIEPGDLLICNDPFRVGNHVNDMCFIRPVFHARAVVGFVVIRAHQLDMGGIVPGGFGLRKFNVYENGLVMSPQRLFHRDQPVKEAMRTIVDNTRFGDLLLPDFHTIHACCALGERLVAESVERYGPEAWAGAMRYTVDAAAAAMRAAIAKLPDGEWSGADFVDSNGVDDVAHRLEVTLRKRGARLEVDLGGSSPQARTALNATALDAQTAVALAVKLALDPHTPFTSGLYRDIDVVVPAGSIVGAAPPAAVMFYFEVQSALVNAVLRALAAPLGPRALAGAYGSTNLHTGEGENADGTRWFSAAELEAQYGAWGATDAGDGNNHCGLAMLNMIMPSVEEIEPRVPALISAREYRPDTAGAGRHRGGAGLVKQSVFLSPGEHHLVPLHFRTASGHGVCGGADGALGGGWWLDLAQDVGERALDGARLPALDEYRGATPIAGYVDPRTAAPAVDGEFAFFGREAVWRRERGAVLRWHTNGGGGWGDPYTRDVEAVLRDVRDEYVSIVGARRDYGVCVLGDPASDPEGLTIDHAATARLRAAPRVAPAPAPHAELPAAKDGLQTERAPVPGACPACGASRLARYAVLSEGGWYDATKCQACLTSVERQPDAEGPVRLRSRRL
ncbi:MAG: hydantoinase B/oxoprolinase family protein [Gammaproteobacteria bacterium]